MSPTSDTKTRIKDVFSRSLADTGYLGVSLEAVAGEVGIKKPSIYHHFPGGKEMLYAEISQDYIDVQAARLNGALAHDGDLFTRLVAIVNTYAGPADALGALDQRIYEALPHVEKDVRTAISSDYVTRLLNPVVALFQAEMDSGDLAGPSAALLANAFLHLIKATDLDPTNKETPGNLVNLFLNGARPRAQE
jgi:AcrR family transcriptional regulator